LALAFLPLVSLVISAAPVQGSERAPLSRLLELAGSLLVLTLHAI
jgi:hypothetical protein